MQTVCPQHPGDDRFGHEFTIDRVFCGWYLKRNNLCRFFKLARQKENQ